jgi:hypothetical protein
MMNQNADDDERIKRMCGVNGFLPIHYDVSGASGTHAIFSTLTSLESKKDDYDYRMNPPGKGARRH